STSAYRYLHSFPTRRSSDLYLACASQYVDGRVADAYVLLECLRRGRQLYPPSCYRRRVHVPRGESGGDPDDFHDFGNGAGRKHGDRKSTRLNSSHLVISYAV